MLRIAEQFHDSDLGRQRQGNEDNYFVRAPLFVVADGMGGAHVGDSRAYLLRGGDLIRLTRDHSLVGELVARGKLTEEQAESHPQRSVITRALGPEPEVQVDVQAYRAHDGDLFLLCSDGLTSMVPEGRVKPIIESASSLADAGRELIAAANEAGGRDNITVVLFRLEDVDGAAAAAEAEAGETTEYDTWEGDALGGPRQGVSRPSAHASDETEAEYRRTGTIALSAG